jgi:cell division topological specificity factor
MFGLFGRNKSKDQLKKRLQMVLVADRAGLPPAKLDELKNELLQVISKYFPGDETNMDVSLQQEGERMVLRANLPAKQL